VQVARAELVTLLRRLQATALNVVVGIDQLADFMRRSGGPARDRVRLARRAGLVERGRARTRPAARTLPLFGFSSPCASINDGVLLYPLRTAVSARRSTGRRHRGSAQDRIVRRAGSDVGAATGWREWPPAALGVDERDLLARVVDTIRLQILHTLDYRHALSNPGSADERRRGREVSRTIARDMPLARDLSNSLL
jgi:hypothetical protein